MIKARLSTQLISKADGVRIAIESIVGQHRQDVEVVLKILDLYRNGYGRISGNLLQPVPEVREAELSAAIGQ